MRCFPPPITINLSPKKHNIEKIGDVKSQRAEVEAVERTRLCDEPRFV
jgi:hypothetical protein